MQSMILVDIDTPAGCSYLKTSGNLNLIQKSPISTGSMPKNIYNKDIFPSTFSPYNILSLVNYYSKRNTTLSYTYDKFVMPFYNSNYLEIDVTLYIPSYQTILYYFFNKDIVSL